MSWATAHQKAMVAVAHAYGDYHVDPGGYVDVFAALQAAGVTVMGQRLPRLFGMYFGRDLNGPAILVNSNLNETTLRHTAAHELGHHALNHGTLLDTNLDLEAENPRNWSQTEMDAEAFATWFLMPRAALRRAMSRIGITQITMPQHAYQLALWLGTSYRGTVRHLLNLRMITPSQMSRWISIPPSQLRREFGHEDSNRCWSLGLAAHEALLHVEIGDQLVLDRTVGECLNTSSLPTGIASLPHQRPPSDSAASTSPTTSFILEPGLANRTRLQAGDDWHVDLVLSPDRQGRSDGWQF